MINNDVSLAPPIAPPPADPVSPVDSPKPEDPANGAEGNPPQEPTPPSMIVNESAPTAPPERPVAPEPAPAPAPINNEAPQAPAFDDSARDLLNSFAQELDKPRISLGPIKLGHQSLNDSQQEEVNLINDILGANNWTFDQWSRVMTLASTNNPENYKRF